MSMKTEANGLSDALVLFGVTGDLAKKKLFPAVYHMVMEGTLPPDAPVVGVSSSNWTDDQLQERARESIASSVGSEPFDADAFNSLAGRLTYVSGDYRDAA